MLETTLLLHIYTYMSTIYVSTQFEYVYANYAQRGQQVLHCADHNQTLTRQCLSSYALTQVYIQ